MSQSPDPIDQAMRSHAKQYLKTLDRPRPGSTSLGFYFAGIFIFLWASSLTGELGYTPFQGLGIAIFFGIGLGLAALLVGINRLLSKMGLSRPLRSALWFSAVSGPYLAIAARSRWENPVWGHLAGFATTILAFCISLVLDKATERRPRPDSPQPQE
jgi:hypothetical protein